MMKNTVFTVIAVLLMLATLCHLDADWVNEQTLLPNGGSVEDVAFVDNTYLISASGERLVRWNVDSGDWTHYHDVGSEIRSMSISWGEANYFVVYGKENGDIGMRYTDDLSWRGGWDAHAGPVTAMAHVNGYTFASGEDDRPAYVKIWDLTGTRAVRKAVGKSSDMYTSGPWKIWDMEVLEGIGHNLREHYYVYPAIGWSYLPSWKVWGGNDDDWPTEHEGTYTPYDRPNTYSVAINRGGTGYIAGGNGDSTITVWRESTGNRYTTLHGHAQDVDELDFHPSRWWELASGSDDDDVHVWDITDGTYDLLRGHTDDIRALAYSPNGNIIASGSWDGEVKIWRRSGAAAPDATSKAQPSLPINQTALLSNYPNPFNPETWIPYLLAEPAEVQVSIHSADGQLVRKLELGQVPAGVYQSRSRAVHWDGRNAQGEPVASGVYFYTLTAGEFSATRKMVIRK